MRAEPDNCTPPTARSRLDLYGAILAGLQAVRPRCAAGAAPGPRLRVPRTQNTPETTEKRSQQPKARLDQLRRFRDDPVALIPARWHFRRRRGAETSSRPVCRFGKARVGTVVALVGAQGG